MEFIELIRDANEEPYEGCTKYSKLSFLLKLYHIKCLCGISDKAMNMMIEFLKDAFEQAKIPSSFYEAKKTINKLGLNYTKIHVCPNDCVLYWGNDENKETCKKCHTSRWNPKGTRNAENGATSVEKRKKQATKVLRYFPLKSRLQRLFMSSKMAKHMRWHVSKDSKDGKIRGMEKI